MPSSSGTFALSNIISLSLSSDNNPDQTQEIPHVGEQNVDKEVVDLDIGKSSHNKQKKLRSDVWKMFERCKDENGKDLAKCSLCEKWFDGSSKKGTTHLRNHFKSCQNKRNEGGASGSGDKPAGNSVTDQQLNHLDRNHFKSGQNNRNGGAASGSGDKPAGNSVMDQQLDHLERVKMLIKHSNRVLLEQVRNADIMIDVYNEEKEKLRMEFEKLSCRFSLMIISTIADGKYAGFMVSFIDDDWKLKEKIIGFKFIEGDQNMKVLKIMLLDLGIDNKIYSIVTNGSDERENRFSDQGSLLFNCKFCVHDFYGIEIDCPSFESLMDEVIGDHMSKILNYIIETPSKTGTFQIAIDRARLLGKEVTAEDIPTKEMLQNMSWLDLINIALGLKDAFFELENMDHHFKSINLTKEQWDVIPTFYQFCDEDEDFDKIYRDFLDYKTANMYFPMLCRIYKKSLVSVACCNSFNYEKIYLGFVRDAKKRWDQSNLILAVAAVLDPRFKMDIVKHWYKDIYGDECEAQLAIFMEHFTGVYNEYAKGTNNFQSSTSGSKETKSSISCRMLDISGYTSHDPDSGQSHNFELHLYLKYFRFPLIKDFDILEWWRDNSQYFPTLAKMARDFLSIKVIIPRDYTFFGYNIPHFDSEIAKEAFVCTKSWLKNEEYE